MVNRKPDFRVRYRIREFCSFTVTASYWPENRFSFLTGIFHRSRPVFFGKRSGSVRGGFGSFRSLPEEIPKKPRIQPG